MKISEKEHKKIKKSITKSKSSSKKEEKLPIWFDKEINSEASLEEQKELDELLKEFS